MSDMISGTIDQGCGRRVAIIEARYHPHISAALVDGALDVLRASGVVATDMVHVQVPGVFEIPLVAQRLADTGVWHSIICIGVVIRGETLHFEHVTQSASQGIVDIACRAGIPIINAIIPAETLAHAAARAGGQHGNRGADAARTALTMMDVMTQLDRRVHTRRIAT